MSSPVPGKPCGASASKATPEYFTVFGVQPILGRTFLPDDGVKGRDNVAVLNYKLWASQFNQDPGVIGRKIVVNGNPYTVIGVMPRLLHAGTQ